MADRFKPAALREKEPYQDAEWDFLKDQARVCLLLRMSWREWESLDNKTQLAFIYAHNELQEDIAAANK